VEEGYTHRICELEYVYAQNLFTFSPPPARTRHAYPYHASPPCTSLGDNMAPAADASGSVSQPTHLVLATAASGTVIISCTYTTLAKSSPSQPQPHAALSPRLRILNGNRVRTGPAYEYDNCSRSRVRVRQRGLAVELHVARLGANGRSTTEAEDTVAPTSLFMASHFPLPL